MTEQERAAFNRAIEIAAKIAGPERVTPKGGAWQSRRIQIASEIRACLIEQG